MRGNLAIEDLDVIAYMGVPLNDEDDNTIGSFCMIEHEPRRWKPDELELLYEFASAVMDRIAVQTA